MPDEDHTPTQCASHPVAEASTPRQQRGVSGRTRVNRAPGLGVLTGEKRLVKGVVAVRHENGGPVNGSRGGSVQPSSRCVGRVEGESG